MFPLFCKVSVESKGMASLLRSLRGRWVAVSSLWDESIQVFLVHVDVVVVEDV